MTWDRPPSCPLPPRAHVTGGSPAAETARPCQHFEDAGAQARYLIRHRDAKFPALFDRILADSGIKVVLSDIRTPRMNSITERWVQTCRHELLDRTLIWNERHLHRVLREFETHHNTHRPHQAMRQAAPLRPVPQPIIDPNEIARLDIRRHDRLGGTLHEYRHAA
ncbi:integrase core domain-containing protein [Streptomyces sp. NPDC056723]|uniref:integrase core domain-containing protein n=1 Tax=Streptomyces sp. NPDC056723 TaxID=3345925 RepID=UPI0036AAB64B